ncbi:MAG: methyltransferase domain-containing protein [Opitutaceae bacterium]|nr:methyltransferase domain-containing protein [Cytophagales bacterium]
MPDFSKRSYQKELLDRDDIPFSDLERNLLELDFINTYLGGHSVTISGLKALLTNRSKIYTILDIGSGGGDTMRFIAQWALKASWKTNLVGLDYKKEAIEFATLKSRGFSNISFVQSDYKDLAKLDFKPDIIISSLFCHHLNDDQLIKYLKLINQNSRIGFVINDLHRNPFAYYSIKWITMLFSSSYLVKNDACLSVIRGFSKKELGKYFEKAEIPLPEIKWKWAFRWLITLNKSPIKS